MAFTCPHCGNQTQVSDEFAGMSGPCAKCGQTITISRAFKDPLALPPEYMPRAEEPSILPRLLTTIGLALLIGALFVAMAYYFFFYIVMAGHGGPP
jgi:hypothetical protein